jgi:transposase-like protein
MPRRSKYPPVLMDRGVGLALEPGRPGAQVARDLGIGHEALRKRVRQAEADGGLRPDLPTSEGARGDPQAAQGSVRAAPRE